MRSEKKINLRFVNDLNTEKKINERLKNDLNTEKKVNERMMKYQADMNQLNQLLNVAAYCNQTSCQFKTEKEVDLTESLSSVSHL